VTVVIVDTNVWVTASGHSGRTPDCAKRALNFIVGFQDSADRLAVDHKWKIMGEYFDNINQQDVAFEIELLLPNRLEYCPIELDADGIAIVPAKCAVHDLSDRKFVAVALAHEAHPPIYNASDEEWLEDQALLANCGVQVIHLCEAELRQHLAQKR
jgi:hypothetical protein